MRSSRLFFLTSIGIAALGQAPSFAQQGNAPSPPVLERLEEGQAPAVTVRKPGEDNKATITQKREQGKVTQVQVKSGGSTYYLKPNEQPGSILPGEGQSTSNRGAQWQVLQFDLKRAKEGKQPDAQDGQPAQPPVPASAAPAK